MISNDILAKFKKLYYEKFNISLSDEETTQMANDLVNLMKVLLEPDSEEVTSESYNEERRQDEIISAHTS